MTNYFGILKMIILCTLLNIRRIFTIKSGGFIIKRMNTIHPAAWLIIILIASPMLNSSVWAKEMTDEKIMMAVEKSLYNDPAVDARLIDVAARNGIVSLSGVVFNILSKDRSTMLAEKIKGVRSVINQIKVESSVPDHQLQKDIREAIRMDPATENYNITTRVEDGVVTIEGKVDSWQKSFLCEHIVKSVRGVLGIKNRIVVYSQFDRPDAELEKEIGHRLKWDVWVDDALIDVKVRDGRVELSGVVGSAAEKRRAWADSLITGVTSVNHSDLTVDWRKKNTVTRSRKTIFKDDKEIYGAVLKTFNYDPRVYPSSIRIMVEDGIVTLSGSVKNLKAKQAAERDAENTVGVWLVKNYLKVRPQFSSSVTVNPMSGFDLQLAERVRRILLMDPYVHQHEISVSVNDQIVRLTGTVDSDFQKNHAKKIASRIDGVVFVQNSLNVRRKWTPKEDWVIRKDIEDELWWSPFVDADDIKIVVEDGKTTLSGTVDTLRERRAATKNAYDGGSKRVVNHLKVRNARHGNF